MTEKERKKLYSDLDLLYESGDLCSVENFLTEKAALYAGVNDACLSCLSELGAFYRGLSRYEEALEMFRKAETLIIPLFGDISRENAVNLNNMAGVYRMTGDRDRALEFFLESIHICESLAEKDKYIYASALNNVSLLYQSAGDYEKAERYMRASIKLLEEVPEAKNALVTACSNLSFQLNFLGRQEEAVELLDRSIALFRTLRDRGDHYAAALNGRGVLAAEQGKYAEAGKDFLEALDIIKTRLGQNADYGTTCRNMARMLVKNGEYGKALSYMGEAFETFNRVFGGEHETTKSAARELSEMEKPRARP